MSSSGGDLPSTHVSFRSQTSVRSTLPPHLKESDDEENNANKSANASNLLGNASMTDLYRASSRGDLLMPDFYQQEGWVDRFFEILFKVQDRKSTIRLECYYGFVHFISCLYVMAVVPVQLGRAGYPYRATVVAVGACCSVGCIFGGLFTNLPFVLAPPTVISIYFSVYIQSKNMTPSEGSIALLISGAILIVFFLRPVGRLADRLIPLPIQVGTTIGVGLITALAGAVDINVIVAGKYTLLASGLLFSKESIITLAGIILTTSLLFHKIKGAFCVGLVFCSVMYWAVSNTFPAEVAAVPETVNLNFSADYKVTSNIMVLVLDLVFLYILYLSGVISAFGSLSNLKREDGTTPRSRWFYIWTGAMCFLSGLIGGAPVLISPESTAGIKAGAKTGLSTVVCGIYFGIACFFAPLFAAVPPAGTSPLLIMIGVLLMQDVNRLNWKKVEDAAPAFAVLFFIPFTFSIIHGVSIGYIVYILTGITSGTLYPRALRFLVYYFPCLNIVLEKYDKRHYLNSIDYGDNSSKYVNFDDFPRGSISNDNDKNASSSNNINNVNNNQNKDEVRSLEFNRNPSKESSVAHRTNSAQTQSSIMSSVNNPLRRSAAMHLVSVDRSVDSNFGFVPNVRSSDLQLDFNPHHDEQGRGLDSEDAINPEPVLGPDGKLKDPKRKVGEGFVWGGSL